MKILIFYLYIHLSDKLYIHIHLATGSTIFEKIFNHALILSSTGMIVNFLLLAGFCGDKNKYEKWQTSYQTDILLFFKNQIYLFGLVVKIFWMKICN